MKKHLILASTLTLLAAACSGPTTPIDATLKEFPQKVRLQAAEVGEPVIAPLPPTAPQVIGGLTPFAPRVDIASPSSTPTVATTAPPLPVECPKAGPGTTALLAAGPAVLVPPAPKQYTYRTSGKHVVGGAQASTVDFPRTATRAVGATTFETSPAGTVTGLLYDVTVTLGTNRTATTYRVVPANVAPVGGAPGPGLFIVRIRTLDAGGRTVSTFQPVPAMLLMPFPADQGVTFNVASTDAASGTTMAYAGAVGDHVRVDACGAVIDTRQVTISGRLTGRSCGTSACPSGVSNEGTTLAEFSASYDIATQYGGIAVQDQVNVTGVGLDVPFSDELFGVISSVPEQGRR